MARKQRKQSFSDYLGYSESTQEKQIQPTGAYTDSDSSETSQTARPRVFRRMRLSSGDSCQLAEPGQPIKRSKLRSCSSKSSSSGSVQGWEIDSPTPREPGSEYGSSVSIEDRPPRVPSPAVSGRPRTKPMADVAPTDLSEEESLIHSKGSDHGSFSVQHKHFQLKKGVEGNNTSPAPSLELPDGDQCKKV